VLDWSCTPTCLTLFDWLKLEDINTSLFFVTCNRRSRRRHQLGERQPRWLKFFQAQASCTADVFCARLLFLRNSCMHS